MVKVEIVEERDQDAGNSPYASQSSSRTSSSVSLSSVGSEPDGEETFYERLTALVDIVPPTTRHKISSRVSQTAGFFKSSGKLVGNLIWILTTSALLVGLPLALSLEDEAKIVAQEKELLAQQQGAQQVRPPSLSRACELRCVLQNARTVGLPQTCHIHAMFSPYRCWRRPCTLPSQGSSSHNPAPRSKRVSSRPDSKPSPSHAPSCPSHASYHPTTVLCLLLLYFSLSDCPQYHVCHLYSIAMHAVFRWPPDTARARFSSCRAVPTLCTLNSSVFTHADFRTRIRSTCTVPRVVLPKSALASKVGHSLSHHDA